MSEKKDEKPQESPVGSTIQRKFLKERKIFLWGEVSDESAKEITETLLYLEADAPGEPITFYVNTPGGSITAGMAIYDTIKMISSEVSVIVTGMAASMGSILLSAPKKGNRYLYPHSYVMIHQPLIAGQLRGPAVDIHIHAQYLEQLRVRLNKILSDASGQPLERIKEDTDRDFYMTAEEAINYGLADKIIDEV